MCESGIHAWLKPRSSAYLTSLIARSGLVNIRVPKSIAHLLPPAVSTEHKSRNDFLILVGVAGFEPATTRTPSVCATRLRHTPTDALNAARMQSRTALTSGGHNIFSLLARPHPHVHECTSDAREPNLNRDLRDRRIRYDAVRAAHLRRRTGARNREARSSGQRNRGRLHSIGLQAIA